MTVDVQTEITIDRPIEVVAPFAANPSNVPEWYVNIRSVEWQTDEVIEVGAAIAFVARFMGRTLKYTYRIESFVPDRSLIMRTAEGPFPMETSYTWTPIGTSKTHMTLRNRGEPSGFSAVLSPLMSAAMRRANNKDLTSLKRVLESAN